MKKLYITKGHKIKNGKGTGAISPFGDEAVECDQLVIDIAKELYKAHGIMTYTEDNSWSLTKVVRWLKHITTRQSITIDFHFNAYSNTSAKGTEVIIPNEYSYAELELAEKLTNTITRVLGTRKRKGNEFFFNHYYPSNKKAGIKVERESQHKGIAILNKPKGINVLVETCFISNPHDMQKYRENYNELVTALSETIASFYDEVS